MAHACTSKEDTKEPLNSIDACRAATGRKGEGVNLDNLSRKAEADNVRADAVNVWVWSWSMFSCRRRLLEEESYQRRRPDRLMGLPDCKCRRH